MLWVGNCCLRHPFSPVWEPLQGGDICSLARLTWPHVIIPATMSPLRYRHGAPPRHGAMCRGPLSSGFYPVCDDNLRTSLVHTAEKQAATCAGTYTFQHPRCRTCGHISSKTDLLGPKDRLILKESFTCLSSGLIYCISCRRCPAIHIGETGRTLRERFGELLRSIDKNAPGFPVVEHFSCNGYTAADVLVRGIKL